MEHKEYVDRYTGQSVDELIALEATHRVDSIILALEEAIDQKRAQHGDAAINQIERNILAVVSLEREVNNGGFDQFFTNMSYEYVPSIVDILKNISCPNTATIAKKAIDALELENPDFDSIVDRVNSDDEALRQVLEACDNAFYDYPDDIESRLFEYIKEHREHIRLA